MILDATKPLTLKKKLEYELEGFGIRLNKYKPDICKVVTEILWFFRTEESGKRWDINTIDGETYKTWWRINQKHLPWI